MAQKVANKFSKTQIRKLGDQIRNDYDNVSEANLKLLQEYRKSFKESISEIFTFVSISAKSVYTESISSFRIKRLDSIIRKLRRIEGMELDRMGDIAGCRSIIKNENQLRKLEKLIRKRYYIAENQTRDYYKKANETGYRSLHLYIKTTESDPNLIELQLRTLEDHNWATLVEITDLLFDDNAKESKELKNTKYGRFHLLLSKKEELTPAEKKEVLNIAIETKLYEKLSSIFIKNYIDVRSQWECSNINKRKVYFVIDSQKDQHPIIRSFENYDDAELEYFNRFIENSKSNILLTHLSNSSYKQISIAYSNYILTMHTFLDDYINLLKEMIYYSVKERKVKLFSFYYSEFLETMVRYSKEFEAENIEIEKITKTRENKQNYRLWKEDLKRRFDKVMYDQKTFSNKISTVFPKSGFYRILFKNSIKRINRKNNQI